MKQFFLGVSTCLLIMSATAQVKKTGGIKPPKPQTAGTAKVVKAVPNSMKNNLDSFSYALGMNIANNLKQQNITQVNNAAMTKGMNHVFNKKPLELNDQQANMVIQKKLQDNQAEKCNVEKQKGLDYMAKNKKKPGVITLPSGIQYEVIKKGDQSSAMPKLPDTVVVHYAGTLIDGTPFDDSYSKGQPLTRHLTGLIDGWGVILQLMHIGDKFKVTIPSELAYRERGAGADIPGCATLLFDMELVGFMPGPAAPIENK
jgi:FKBP-type peptidyl-prolyl cis-trans isomerase FklB